MGHSPSPSVCNAFQAKAAWIQAQETWGRAPDPDKVRQSDAYSRDAMLTFVTGIIATHMKTLKKKDQVIELSDSVGFALSLLTAHRADENNLPFTFPSQVSACKAFRYKPV